MWKQEDYIKAYRFAAQAHQGQTFPGTDLPYLMHLGFVAIEVIAALKIEPQINEALAVQCALLHDTIEDTRVTFAQVAETFGSDVAQGVLALSKNKELPKEEQMADSLCRIQEQPQEIWIVKMADRISNLQKPPLYWHINKIRKYQVEAKIILEFLQDASPYLASRLHHKISEYSLFISQDN